jgi:xylulose-5-phosphate/fructose-6-phosphate phosphoketolase
MAPPKGTPTTSNVSDVSDDLDFVSTKLEHETLTKPAAETDEQRNTPIPKEFELLDKYWKASNYLAAGQIYLMEHNPLLRRQLELGDIKPRLVGHWGTCPGQNFIYTHLNRVIKERELQMLYISGPGHGGNFLIAQNYLEGSYSDYYPNISQDEVRHIGVAVATLLPGETTSESSRF